MTKKSKTKAPDTITYERLSLALISYINEGCSCIYRKQTADTIFAFLKFQKRVREDEGRERAIRIIPKATHKMRDAIMSWSVPESVLHILFTQAKSVKRQVNYYCNTDTLQNQALEKELFPGNLRLKKPPVAISMLPHGIFRYETSKLIINLN